jgi:hypothetical protein
VKPQEPFLPISVGAEERENDSRKLRMLGVHDAVGREVDHFVVRELAARDETQIGVEAQSLEPLPLGNQIQDSLRFLSGRKKAGHTRTGGRQAAEVRER